MFSETGEYRKSNQDAVLAVHTDYAGVFAVADGMGGHYRGEMASQKAVSLLENWWDDIRDCMRSMMFLDLVFDLEKRIREINESVYRMYREMGKYGGTTLCVLMVCGDAYAVLNVGDSRLYRCQKRICEQMTTDDVWENQYQVRRVMRREDLQNNPSYGRLVQAVGTGHDVGISVRTGCMEKKACFFLCSDGVYKYCDESWLFSKMKRIRREKDVDVFAENVKETVYRNGARDNLSLVLVLADKGRMR